MFEHADITASSSKYITCNIYNTITNNLEEYALSLDCRFISPNQDHYNIIIYSS